MSDLEDALAYQMRAVGLPEPEREYRFAPPRRWRADFAFPSLMLLVEVEGGTYQQGRHNRHAGYRGDCEKYNAAVVGGWRVLRFTGDMVTGGEAVITIEEAIKAKP